MSTTNPPRARSPFTEPVGPRFWQRRENFHIASVALQEHLCDGSGSAKVTVDLKGWVGVEKIRQRHLAQQVSEQLVCAITVVKPSPEVHFPCHAPALAAVAAPFKRLEGGFVVLRRVVPIDLRSGVQAKKMRHMAVFGIFLFVVFDPFLNTASRFADLHWLKAGHRRLDFLAKVSIKIPIRSRGPDSLPKGW